MLASIAAIVFARVRFRVVWRSLWCSTWSRHCLRRVAFARHATRSRGVTGVACRPLRWFVVSRDGADHRRCSHRRAQPGAAARRSRRSPWRRSGICYFVSFAPPTWLRRAWQEPEMRHSWRAPPIWLACQTCARWWVSSSARGDAVGASGAKIALWDPDAAQLKIFADDDAVAFQACLTRFSSSGRRSSRASSGLMLRALPSSSSTTLAPFSRRPSPPTANAWACSWCTHRARRSSPAATWS